jgi:hypothetical protein
MKVTCTLERWTSTHFNARLEGFNGLLQAARARARGYRSLIRLLPVLMLSAGPALAGIKIHRYEPVETDRCFTEDEQRNSSVYTGLRLCEPWEDPTYKTYYPDYQAPARKEVPRAKGRLGLHPSEDIRVRMTAGRAPITVTACASPRRSPRPWIAAPPRSVPRPSLSHS